MNIRVIGTLYIFLIIKRRTIYRDQTLRNPQSLSKKSKKDSLSATPLRVVFWVKELSKMFKLIHRAWWGIIKKIGIIVNMPPAPAITLAQIMIELNGPTGVGEWVRVPGYYGMSSPTIDSEGQLNFFASTNGALLILFINGRTSETRSFVAKFTDDPIRSQLWQ